MPAASSIQSGRLTAAATVERKTVELTARVSSECFTKASTLTRWGRRQQHQHVSRILIQPRQHTAQPPDRAGNSASLIRVSSSTEALGRSR